MQPKHMIIAFFIAVIWGSNFVFIQVAIEEIPPVTLCALRFLLSSIPLIFWMKRPAVSWGLLSVYSLLTFSLQFTFLFMGMKAGVSPGLASLLGQMQVFFSFLLAAVFLGERITRFQVAGAGLAFSGVFIVIEHLGGGDISRAGFLWLLASTIVWALGNLSIKKMKSVQGMNLIVWASALACPPLIIASYYIDGAHALTGAMHHLSWQGAFALFFIAYASTWFGYGLWAWLLSVYSVGMVVPFTLLVPVVGMMVSSVVLGESLPAWKIIAATLILFGLMVHLFGAYWSRLLKLPWGKSRKIFKESL